MLKVKHISFDLDGTLINSIPAMQQAWSETMFELGLAVGFDKYKKYIGLPFSSIMKKLNLDRIEKEIEALYFQKTKKTANKINLNHGAIDILEWCRSKSISTSIITSKPRENAENIISMNKLNVDLLICGNDYRTGKPSPENGLKVIKKFSLNPYDIVYVGDMIFDLQFAQNLNAHYIHFINEDENLLPKNLVNKIRLIKDLIEIKELVDH